MKQSNNQSHHNHAEHEENHHNHGDNNESHNHSNHEHGGHDHHGHMVTEFRNKFFIILIFTIPIVLLSPMIQSFIGVDWQFSGDIYIVAALATFVYFYGGWPFIKGAYDELKNKYGMESKNMLELAEEINNR